MSLISYASLFLRRAGAHRYPSTCKNCINKVKNVSYSSVATKTIHDVNTNVTKDVILFKYENPKFYMYMNLFAVVQYMFWSYLGIFAFSTLRDAPVDKSKITDDTPWFRKINLGENKYRNTLGSVAMLVGKNLFLYPRIYSNNYFFHVIFELQIFMHINSKNLLQRKLPLLITSCKL